MAAAAAAAKLLSSGCGIEMSRGGEARIKREQISGSLIHWRSCIEEQGPAGVSSRWKRNSHSERRCEVCATFCHIMRRLLEKSVFGSVGLPRVGRFTLEGADHLWRRDNFVSSNPPLAVVRSNLRWAGKWEERQRPRWHRLFFLFTGELCLVSLGLFPLQVAEP